MQGHLFPINIINEEPANLGTADLSRIGWDEQGRRYALKTLDDHPLLPMTEWLGYHLCHRLRIPTPEFAIVRRLHGQLALGSRWEEGAIDLNLAALTLPVLARLLMDARHDMGAAFGLDMFLPNHDRRLGNFLFKRTRTGARALAFDWSRVDALQSPAFERWPWEISSPSHTTRYELKRNGWIDDSESRRVLADLAMMTAHDIDTIIQAAPDAWTCNLEHAAIINWWTTCAATRAQQCTNLL